MEPGGRENLRHAWGPRARKPSRIYRTKSTQSAWGPRIAWKSPQTTSLILLTAGLSADYDLHHDFEINVGKLAVLSQRM